MKKSCASAVCVALLAASAACSHKRPHELAFQSGFCSTVEALAEAPNLTDFQGRPIDGAQALGFLRVRCEQAAPDIQKIIHCTTGPNSCCACQTESECSRLRSACPGPGISEPGSREIGSQCDVGSLPDAVIIAGPLPGPTLPAGCGLSGQCNPPESCQSPNQPAPGSGGR